jgi:hypothetical protein
LTRRLATVDGRRSNPIAPANIGIGGRWWHFTTNSIDSFQQLLQHTTDRYGGFVQASFKFGD